MANANDDAIVRQMMALPDRYMAEYFTRNAHLIIDDSTYWNVLGTLWKLGGTVIQQVLWINLFSSTRKKRHKIMKKHERKFWRRLPSTVVAYRAVNNIDEAGTAISWTLSKDIANSLFSEGGSREVVTRAFYKADIFAYFDRRKEQEIIVLCAHAK